MTVTQPGPQVAVTVTATATVQATANAQGEATQISEDGVYVIGQDIPRGTWHTSGGTQCYEATLASTDTSNIIDNNNFSGPDTVDLSGAKAFDISTGCTWTHEDEVPVLPSQPAAPASSRARRTLALSDLTISIQASKTRRRSCTPHGSGDGLVCGELEVFALLIDPDRLFRHGVAASRRSRRPLLSRARRPARSYSRFESTPSSRALPSASSARKRSTARRRGHMGACARPRR